MDMDFDGTPGLGAAGNAPEQALGPYIRAVRRNWLLVAAITLLTGVVAVVTVLRSEANYQASATVLVSPLEQSDENFIDTGVVLSAGEPTRTIQTAAALVNSFPAARLTAAAMGRGWTTADVQSAVSVTPLGQSDILDVTAQASSGALARTLANTFATTAVSYRASVVQHNISAQLSELNSRLSQISGSGVGGANLAQQLATRIAALRAAQVGGGDPTLAVNGLASAPGSPTGASHLLIVLLALLGGFAIGSVAALGVDFFNRRVRDLDEVESLLPAPVLAAVPQVGMTARGNLRPGAFPPGAFEQVRMLRVQLSNRKGAPVIMLTSAGSGDGKTTLASALAAAFAETGEQVILMDLDLRKPDVARLLGLKQPRAVDLAESTLDELLVEVPDLPNVRVLPAPRGDLAMFSMLLGRLPALLDEAESKSGHVIIDAAPVGVASESLEIAKICDQVVVAVRPGHTDRQRLILARDLLTRANAPVVGVVVVAHSTAKADDVYDYYGYGYSYGADRPAGEMAERDTRSGGKGSSDEEEPVGVVTAQAGSRASRRTRAESA
jgi:polysaccharide biosynthesis transport protein